MTVMPAPDLERQHVLAIRETGLSQDGGPGQAQSQIKIE